MSQWVQVAGYAGDLQAAYDHYKTRAGESAAEHFLVRYLECVGVITAYPESCAVRGHGWRTAYSFATRWSNYGAASDGRERGSADAGKAAVRGAACAVLRGRGPATEILT